MRTEWLLVLVLGCGALLPGRAAAQAPAAGPGLDSGAERLSLQEAVARALRRNPSVVVAEQEILRADALVRQARASSLPTLQANLAYTRLDADRTLPGAEGEAPRVITSGNQLAGNLSLNAPLLAPQRWVQWLHASDNRRVFAANAVEVRRQIAAATGRAYLTLLALRRNIEVLSRARDTAQAHLQFARARRTGGIGNRLDEVRAGQELATNEAQVHAADAQAARAREALGVLVGGEAPIECADEGVLPAPPAPEAALSGVEGRGDVRTAAARTWAQRRVVRDSWTDYMPLLSAVFQPFLQEPPTLVQPQFGWQAQLILALPLYDGGLRYGLRRERVALLNEAQANLDGALRQARSEVRAALAVLRAADQSLTSATEAARLAGEALGLANLAYRAGATTNLEVIDAERRARDAASAAEAAADTARQARLDLLLASGRFP